MSLKMWAGMLAVVGVSLVGISASAPLRMLIEYGHVSPVLAVVAIGGLDIMVGMAMFMVLDYRDRRRTRRELAALNARVADNRDRLMV